MAPASKASRISKPQTKARATAIRLKFTGVRKMVKLSPSKSKAEVPNIALPSPTTVQEGKDAIEKLIETLQPPREGISIARWTDLEQRYRDFKEVEDCYLDPLGYILSLFSKLQAILRDKETEKLPYFADFPFFDLLPYELKEQVFKEVASQERLIEVERQYGDLEPIPYPQDPRTRIEGTAGWWTEHGARYHHFYRISDKGLKPPGFFYIRKEYWQLFFKKLYSPVCLDNLDPRSAVFNGKRRVLWYNPESDIILFWLNTCSTTLKEFCSRTHELGVDIPRIAVKLNPYCCDWSRQFDEEHADFTISEGFQPRDPGIQPIEFLHGIDPPQFGQPPPWTVNTEMFSYEQDQVKKSFPGCKGFKELIMLGVTDIFSRPGAGMADNNTIARQSYDIDGVCHPRDYAAFRFLRREAKRIAKGKRLSRLESTVPRWTNPGSTFPKISWMQLAQSQPGIPPGWYYRVNQFRSEAMKYIAPSGDLGMLKILAINHNCHVQVQETVGSRGRSDVRVKTKWVEIGIIGSTEQSTYETYRAIMDLQVSVQNHVSFSSLDSSRTPSASWQPELEPGKEICACNTSQDDFESCEQCKIITACYAPPPPLPQYTKEEERRVRDRCRI